MSSDLQKCRYCLAVNKIKNKNSIVVPNISELLKIEVNNKLLCRNDKKKKLGVLKFTVDNKVYIHCPIENVLDNGEVSFGKCGSFYPLEDTARNRQMLSTHKFRFHYNCNKIKSKTLQLKVSKSIEEVAQEFNT